MEIPKTYDPAKVEGRWYNHWMEQKFFRSVPDEREPYTVVIPPPNVTGQLHMGHMLNNTIQDVLIRRARMQGYNACWVPGMDHASIATEAKVVRMLRERGIKKSDLTRQEFLEYAWEWKEKYGGIILEQLKRLGASCDWERTRFTMEEKLSKAVIDVFVDLYNKGYLYRDLRMVNWDPAAKTTLSNEEVIHKEKQSKLYHVKYDIEGSDEHVVIATTRPETILGDTAICINPNDERYQHLKGKKVLVPMVNRPIPIIFDEYVDMEFGTGCLKVTPAHDPNDYELGRKHQLHTIDILNDDGTLSEEAQYYVGEDRFKARKLIVKDLDAQERILNVEEIANKVGFSERTDAVVEPKLSMQWFVDMQKLAGPALENVVNDEIRFFPANFKNLYKHWMENIRDWPISRQLWWGQRIPAYYTPDGGVFVANSREKALELAKAEHGDNFDETTLRQDEDVVDTWFSSWLWPMSVFDGFEDPKEMDYYYPTSVLVTGWDIIFFWVARMIMAGYEYKGEKPFHDVYFTGMVRDSQRRKMSKQLGNSPDALGLINDFGADGVRVGMLLAAPAGNDLLFEEKLCEQGRNFSNKIWNALRLVKGWEVKEGGNADNALAINWMENRIHQAVADIDKSFSTYRISEALMTMYNLIWDDFCSWYLELVKPPYGEAIDRTTLDKTTALFERLMQIAHPFMPFITEEVWHLLQKRDDNDCIIVSQWPKAEDYDEALLKSIHNAKGMVTNIRNFRAQQGLSPKEPLTIYIETDNEEAYQQALPFLKKLGNLEAVHFGSTDEHTTDFTNERAEKYRIPFEVDAEAERERLEEELNYTKGFIKGVEKKLSNERFVNNAPAAVVDKERQKLADGQAKVKAIEESLAKLN